ncbi:MAG: galactokinase family protein [Eubacteriales bacterium]|nr:galactokinase family protein [Christensenellaceae bacterium]MDY5719480.1 galactokinase family protein [Eubacteriales bacterium]
MANGTEQKHTALFGRSPEAVLSAPGRTELCGNHTDHQSGRVIAAAIRRSITAAVSPRADGKCLLHTDIGAFEVSLSTLAPAQGERGASAALVRGVAEYFAAHSLKIGGFNAAIKSDIPIGSGVSSSAAFEVLIGRIFNALYNNGSAEPMTIALAAQYAENAHFGKPCGLMDQAACALGGVQFIDFFDKAAPNVSALEWPFTNEFAIYIINTGSSHADMADAYTQITADMKSVSDILGVDRLGHADEAEFVRRLGEIRRAAGDRTAMRALHFFGENARVSDMAAAIRSADAAAYARIMRQSAASSESLLQNIFTPAQRDRSLAIGIALARRYLDPIGGVARVHGGGFAGTMQALVPIGAEDGFTRYMESFFGKASVIRAI